MRKQSQKQLEFQLNGPYRSYTQRWIRLHQENNRRLLWILLPTILYMFTQNPWFLLIGLCYLAAALLWGKQQQNKLLEELTALERERIQRLEQGMDAWGVPRPRSCTFGYCRTEEDFAPVFLCRQGETLYLSEQVFIKNCIYGVEGQMLYLLDVDEEKLNRLPQQLSLSALKWEKSPLCHQDLLRQEGLRLNRFLVIEGFIYGVLLEEMKAGRRKKPLHTSWHLTQMRKEPVYQTRLPDGRTLLLSQLAWKLLEPERNTPDQFSSSSPQTPEKAGVE